MYRYVYYHIYMRVMLKRPPCPGITLNVLWEYLASWKNVARWKYDKEIRSQNSFLCFRGPFFLHEYNILAHVYIHVAKYIKISIVYCPAWQLYLGMGILNDYKTTAILPISPHSANQCTLPQCHCYDHPTAMPRARIPASDISFFMHIHIYCSDITYHVRMSNICAMPCIFV